MIIDIAVLIVLLIFALIGAVRGFWSMLKSLVKTAIGITVAIFTCKYLATFIDGLLNISGNIAKMIVPELKKLGEIMGTSITSDNAYLLDTPNLNTSGTFGGIVSVVEKMIVGNQDIIGKTPADYVGSVLAGIALLLISASLIFSAVVVTLTIIGKIFNNKDSVGYVHGLDKTLGFTLGLTYGLMAVAVLFVGIFIAYTIPTTTDLLAQGFDNTFFSHKFYSIFEHQLEQLITSKSFTNFVYKLITSI
ncbi:MAG: CvpA family protein [Firmicutes bacterium]|nr:CvpA family protein [Bacillota bacterium]